GFHDGMARHGEEFLADWSCGTVRDVSAELLHLVARVNGRVLLGVEADELVRELEEATDEWMTLNTALTVAGSLSLDLPRSWYEAALASSERVEKLTKQVVAARKTTALAGDDLLVQLLQAHAADPARMTELELVGQTAHMFAAANQSTRSSLIWTLLLL